LEKIRTADSFWQEEGLCSFPGMSLWQLAMKLFLGTITGLLLPHCPSGIGISFSDKKRLSLIPKAKAISMP
jgi:hypothetical protein